MAGTLKFDAWVNDNGSENYKCRAWVNFNGTGTVAIRASGNVSSITDNGVGDYTVNFATAMIDANYAPIATTSRISDSFFNITYKNDSRTVSISQVSFLTKNSNSALEDEPTVTIAIFR
jgi:hypothetical protein